MADYTAAAYKAASLVPQVLENRGLEPIFTGIYQVTRNGHTWLFMVLDDSKIAKIERYTAKDLLHQMSTTLGGAPVILSNSTGLRYAILLSPAPRLPDAANYPGPEAGCVQIGWGHQGQVAAHWPAFGHCLAAGMTRSGKSNFIRLVVLQALQAGHLVSLVDPDGQTYPDSIHGHPGVISYTAGLDYTQALESVQKIWTERQAAKATMDNQPDQPRVMLVIDEFNGLALANGGARGPLAQATQALAFGALKFGIHLVLAGHEFTRDLIGPVAGQMASRLCFAVRAPSTSRVVVGKAGAESINKPGRALTDPWGKVQTYSMSSQEMSAYLGTHQGPRLSRADQELLDLAQQAGGRLTFDVLKQAGYSRGEAERIRAGWISRGLARYEPGQFNSLVVIPPAGAPA